MATNREAVKSLRPRVDDKEKKEALREAVRALRGSQETSLTHNAIARRAIRNLHCSHGAMMEFLRKLPALEKEQILSGKEPDSVK